jgi:hypothetical protein
MTAGGVLGDGKVGGFSGGWRVGRLCRSTSKYSSGGCSSETVCCARDAAVGKEAMNKVTLDEQISVLILAAHLQTVDATPGVIQLRFFLKPLAEYSRIR